MTDGDAGQQGEAAIPEAERWAAEKLGERLARAGVAPAAVVLLESLRPVGRTVARGMSLVHPMVELFVSDQLYVALRDLIERPGGMDLLLLVLRQQGSDERLKSSE